MIYKKHTYFKSTDKIHRIHTIIWQPEDTEIRGILQIAHGMVEYIDRYDGFARFLCQQGIMVVGNDHLGHGDSVNHEDEWGYVSETQGANRIVCDMYKLMRHMQKRHPGVPYFILGHSMGSFLTRKFLMLHGECVQGAVIMGTGYHSGIEASLGKALTQMLGKLKGKTFRSKLINNMAFGSYNRSFTPARTPYDWLTKDEAMVDAYMLEPACTFTFTVNGYESLFDTLIYIQNPKHLEKLPKNLPVFFVSGSHDPVGNFGKGVEKVYNQFIALGMTDVSLKLFDDDRHEILNESDKEQVYEAIYQWINSHL